MGPLKTVEKPWGREIIIAHTRHYALKLIEFRKGSRSSLQYHRRKAEHIYVDSGRVRVQEEIEGCLETRVYRAGEVIEKPPLKKHRLVCCPRNKLHKYSRYSAH